VPDWREGSGQLPLLHRSAWGTQSENAADKVCNGRNHNAAKTHCGTCGLPYDKANTWLALLKQRQRAPLKHHARYHARRLRRSVLVSALSGGDCWSHATVLPALRGRFRPQRAFEHPAGGQQVAGGLVCAVCGTEEPDELPEMPRKRLPCGHAGRWLPREARMINLALRAARPRPSGLTLAGRCAQWPADSGGVSVSC